MGLQNLRYKVERRLARHLANRPLEMQNRCAIVTFTFDDVPQSACVEGRDILERHGCRGTYYACGGLTDTSRAGAKLHSRNDLVTLLERGHEIACHGFAHLDYQTLSAEGVAADVSRNHSYFRELGCEQVVESFAYPYGCISPQVKGFIGPKFSSARGVRRGFNVHQADMALLRGEPLYQHLLTQQALAELIEQNAARKGWLIFFTHGVIELPDQFGCRPSLLDFAVRTAQASGAQILPVNRAVRQIASAD